MQMAVIHTCQRQNFSIGICIDKEFQIYTKAYKKIVNKCLLILKSLHHLKIPCKRPAPALYA